MISIENIIKDRIDEYFISKYGKEVGDQKQKNSLPINDEFLATAVHSFCVWAVAFRNKKTQLHMGKVLWENRKEIIEKLMENKFAQQSKMKMSSGN